MRLRKYILAIASVAFALTIILYIVCFFNHQLSSKTSDWGAFGNYMAMGISVLSAALIFITYQEQRQANQISRFEQHFTSMLNTLKELINKTKMTLRKIIHPLLTISLKNHILMLQIMM